MMESSEPQWGAAPGGIISGGGGGGISSSSLQLARWAATALAVVFAVVLTATIAIDGSPFRSALLTPWMNATLVDYYFTALVACVWVWLREAPRLGRPAAALLIVYFCCLGSFAIWSYVAHLLWARTRAGDSLQKIVLGF